jgi:cytidylate kinase
LLAPLDWRIERVMNLHECSKEKALDLITSKDANRKRFLEFYLGQKFQLQIFDALYNCGYLTLEEIADTIVLQARQRGMF